MEKEELVEAKSFEVEYIDESEQSQIGVRLGT